MRIVSLCPSMTELIFRLGRGDWLVGRTRFCSSPRPQVETIPRIGGTKDPRIAQIVSLQPDLVIFNEEENRREDYDNLMAHGIRCVIYYPRTIDDTYQMVKNVGIELDTIAASENILREIADACAHARALIHAQTSAGTPAHASVCAPADVLTPVHASATRPSPEPMPSPVSDGPSYAYLIWRKPYMTLNHDTYIAAVLSAGGARNCFAGHSARYPSILLEDLLQAQPDVVLLSSEPFPFEEKHVQELMSLTGWERRRFRLVDGAALSWHGSRTAEGIRYAATLWRDQAGESCKKSASSPA